LYYDIRQLGCERSSSSSIQSCLLQTVNRRFQPPFRRRIDDLVSSRAFAPEMPWHVPGNAVLSVDRVHTPAAIPSASILATSALQTLESKRATWPAVCIVIRYAKPLDNFSPDIPCTHSVTDRLHSYRTSHTLNPQFDPLTGRHPAKLRRTA